MNGFILTESYQVEHPVEHSLSVRKLLNMIWNRIFLNCCRCHHSLQILLLQLPSKIVFFFWNYKWRARCVDFMVNVCCFYLWQLVHYDQFLIGSSGHLLNAWLSELTKSTNGLSPKVMYRRSEKLLLSSYALQRTRTFTHWVESSIILHL